MTTGFFTSDQAPAISLEIRGPEGARSFDAVIDTGFNGALALPSEWIDSLDLPRRGEEPIILADGSRIVSPVYLGYAILEETAYEASIAEAPSPLLGTDLLWGFSLYVEFQAGGAVEVDPLPESSS